MGSLTGEGFNVHASHSVCFFLIQYQLIYRALLGAHGRICPVDSRDFHRQDTAAIAMHRIVGLNRNFFYTRRYCNT